MTSKPATNVTAEVLVNAVADQRKNGATGQFIKELIAFLTEGTDTSVLIAELDAMIEAGKDEEGGFFYGTLPREAATLKCRRILVNLAE